jgi:D-serine deaminase-like pyridoxal phosphate-dependent protein
MTTGVKHPRFARRLVISSGVAALAGTAALFAARKSDKGGEHSTYFNALSRALRSAGIAHPVLVIDSTKLDANVAAARRTLKPQKLPLRVVVKSLPSPQLIETVARGMATNRFMVFNGAMLEAMSQLRPDGDLLLGKPLPAAEAARIVRALGPSASANVQWLVDTPARVTQYQEIARSHNTPLRINFEIDVGLHRGGFTTPEALVAAVRLAQSEPLLTISGLMGYDAHVPKMPDPVAAFARSQAIYRDALAAMQIALNLNPSELTLNAAGSPTYAQHARGTAGNEVSVGSAFVKPLDFDLSGLAHHQPAAFIATPVIKALNTRELPGFEWATKPLTWFDPNTARAYFTYGGHWLAKPESPPGLQFSELYGRSSNQEMLTGSTSINLSQDDFVFYRPTQSEAVFLQFGDIAIFDGERISAFWPTFPVSA